MRRIPALIFVATLWGCATPHNNPANLAYAQQTIPTCMTERECELKWAAARRWVLDNAAYKLKTVTPDYLETYSATGGSPSISARVSKEPLSSGGYRIVVSVWCDNMFGCVPDATDSAIKFNREVDASAN